MEIIKIDDLGLALSSSNAKLRKKFSIDDRIKGVVVVGLVPDGVAAGKGVRMGDVIVEVDQGAVNKPSEVVAVIDKTLKKGVKKSVLFTINRQGSIRFIGLKLN